MIMRLTAKVKTIELLGGKEIGENFQNLSLGKDFEGLTPKP